MKRMSFLFAIATIFMSAVLVLSACQPTPETAPIVGKGDNHLEEMIASSAASPPPEASFSSLAEATGAPETFKDSYTNDKGDVTVTVDAKVEMPPVPSLPSVQVRLCGFPQEQVDKIAKYFLKDAPVFTENDVQTKEEFQEMIIHYGKQIEDAKKEHPDHEALIIADMEERIREYQGLYEAAPEKRERTPATLKLSGPEGESGFSVVAELGKDDAARFDVSNSETYGSSCRFINDGKGGYDFTGFIGPSRDAQEETPRGMETTREDAERAVTECLSDLGITGMQVDEVHILTFYGHDYDRGDEEYEASAKQCYAFSLVKTVMGVPAPDIEESTQLDTDDPNAVVQEEPEYNYSIGPEKLEIYVDDTGIVQFEWSNPSETEKVLSEHVTLLPFADVVQRAQDNIFYKNYTAYGSTAEIRISSIKLNMMRIMRKDKPGEFLMLPVWDFIGSQNLDFEGTGEDWEASKTSFVTINAIDGSWINRDWGY